MMAMACHRAYELSLFRRGLILAEGKSGRHMARRRRPMRRRRHQRDVSAGRERQTMPRATIFLWPP